MFHSFKSDWSNLFSHAEPGYRKFHEVPPPPIGGHGHVICMDVAGKIYQLVHGLFYNLHVNNSSAGIMYVEQLVISELI